MISVEYVSKRYLTRQSWRTALYNINSKMERGEKIGILGHNGAGKSTLIRLISGVEPPAMGEIERTTNTSWPLAFSDVFQSSLTGMDNLRFICRIYNVDIDYVRDSTGEFSELGQYLYESVKCYSSGMKARSVSVLSLTVEFDCYLIGEVITAGDSRFVGKCKYKSFEKRKDRPITSVSYSHSAMKQYCDNVMVLEKGHMYQSGDMDKVYEHYNSLP